MLILLKELFESISSAFTSQSFFPSDMVCHDEFGPILLFCFGLQTWKLNLDGFVNQCSPFLCILHHLQFEVKQ